MMMDDFLLKADLLTGPKALPVIRGAMGSSQINNAVAGAAGRAQATCRIAMATIMIGAN